MSTSKAFQRTDNAITNTLIALLREKSFDKITVQDILDATPVNRATFYAHFHDKYEIAERMMEEYIRTEKELRDMLAFEKKANYARIMQQFYARKKDLTEALLKIHTDKVDLREYIASSWKEEYLASSNSADKKIEAEMYAQVMTAFQLSFLEGNSSPDFSLNHLDAMLIEILIHTLQTNPEETRTALYELMRKRDSQHDNSLPSILPPRL